MIHIVFNEPDVTLMQEVIALDETLAGEVILIRDDFAVGPLAGIDTEEGWQARLEWWRQLLQGSPYPEDKAGSFDDRKTVEELIQKLTEDENLEAWIWMGQNQHDVTGYFWLMPQLRAFQGRLMVVYLNNLPFINEKGQLFYPNWLSEIQPKEFLKAKKLNRPITLSEFEVDPDEWKKMVEENAVVRILEGGKKIAGREADFYDKELLAHTTNDWQKASKVLNAAQQKMKIRTGDLFLMHRIKAMIESGILQVQGDLNKGWKDFDIKKNSGEQVAMALESEESGQ